MSYDGELDYPPYPNKPKRKRGTPPRRFGPCGCGCLGLAILTAAAACLLLDTVFGLSLNTLVSNDKDLLETQLALALTQTALAQPPTATPAMFAPTLPPSNTPLPSSTPTVTGTPTSTESPTSTASATPAPPTATPTLTAAPRTILPPPLDSTDRFTTGRVVWSGSTIAVATGDSIILLDSNALGRDGAVVVSPSDIQDIALNRDGTLLAAARADGHIALWNISDPDSPTQIVELALTAAPAWSVAFDPLGRWLVAGGDDGSIRMWRVQDRVEILTQPVLSGPVFALAFDEAGDRLMVGGTEQAILLSHTQPESWNQVQSIVVKGDVRRAAFSPDGTLLALATSSNDSRLELWKLDPTERIAPTEQVGRINDVVFSPDGIVLASGGAGLAQLWIVAAGQVIAWHSLAHNQQAVVSVAFNEDASRLLTLTQDNTLTLWQISEGVSLEGRQL